MTYMRVCDRCRKLCEPDRAAAGGTATIKIRDQASLDIDLCSKCTRIVRLFIVSGVAPAGTKIQDPEGK